MKRVLQLLAAGAAMFLIVQFDVLGRAWDRDIGAKLAPGNAVVMYSLITCTHCSATRERLKQAGIPFTEHFVDTEPARTQELIAILQAHNVPPGSIGTPAFTVNGVLLVNNPDIETIKRHLKYRESS